MRIEFPSDEALPQLRSLWKLAFGDSDAFLDKFYCTAYSPRRCRCILADHQIAAVLYWFDGEYQEQKFAYLYAVATHPHYRNRGLCRALLEDTHTLLAQQGYDAALLMPQSVALRQMYGKMGYRDCCTVSEFDCAAGEAVAVRTVSKTEYARLRREYLPKGGVLQEGENLSYLETYASLYAGADFLLAAAPDGGRLWGFELLGNRASAPGILAALGYEKGHFRTPGKDKPFAMFRPLTKNAKAPDYFGLVFD